MSDEFDTYRVGDVTVIRVPELVLDGFPPARLFADWDPAFFEQSPGAITPGSMTEGGDNVVMHVHCWVLKTPAHTILIDTGVGNDKPRPFTPYFDDLHTPFLDTLARAGVRPEDVDYVLLTHLHVDHVGWNTRLVDGWWRPTFPNARYVFSGRELDYFTDEKNNDDRNKTSFIVQRDSVIPLVDAGVADRIAIDGKDIVDGLSFHPTPGHTIDHASIVLKSAGQQAVFAGDTLHHPIQVYRPDWNSMFDAWADQSRQSRRWVLDYAADHDATLFTTHFPESSAGRVGRNADGGFTWQFL